MRISSFFLLIFLSAALNAETGSSNDTLRIKVGGMIVTDFETDLQLGKEGVPIGAKINTKDQLGMESETGVFRIDGYYRFNSKHSLGLSYYSVKSNSDKYVPNEITWDGNTISDAQIQSYFNMTIYQLYYGYSFYHNEDVELAVTAGLHVMDISLGLKAQGTVNGTADSIVDTAASVTAPLPVIGFKGEYAIYRDTLYVNYSAQYFYIEIEGYKGAFVSNLFTFEYRFLDHYGAGAGFNTNTLAVEKTQGGTIVNASNNLNGIFAYLSYSY